MASAMQRARLNTLMRNGMGRIEFKPTPSGKVWGGQTGVRGVPGNGTAARERFAAWLKKAYPTLYAKAAARAEQKAVNKAQLGQTTADEPGFWASFANSVMELAPTYLQYKTQKDILKVQMDRAAQGLPPLETGEYAPAVQLSLDPEQTRRAAGEAAAAARDAVANALSSPLLWVAGGIGLMLLLKNTGGRRRRR